MRKIGGCDMEKFGTVGSSEKIYPRRQMMAKDTGKEAR